MALPAVPSLNLIIERLPLIFPEGTTNRNYVIREMAARTVYVMFYSGAVEGFGFWARPSQITDMSDAQAALQADKDREAWIQTSLSGKKDRPSNTWYANNSREPVRDETIRAGLVPTRAVVEREGLTATSPLPKYALAASFAALFDASLQGEELEKAVAVWQKSHLSAAALARVKLVKSGATAAADGIEVKLPNGRVRALLPGPSSVIARGVIEDFAPRFLRSPAVLWLSESGNKVDAADDKLARELNLTIDPAKLLPDIILVDLGSDASGAEMLFLFVEIVATDGPISESRKNAFIAVAKDAGFDLKSIAFLTAFEDRGAAAFRKCVGSLAWGSFAWCRAEPAHLIEFRDGTDLEQMGALAVPRVDV